jgi:hypothetical protein
MASVGVCKKPAGAVCSAAVECLGNQCAQGRCCDTACNDGCRSCALAGREGTCSPPSTSEICDDGRDNNCAGGVDETCATIQIEPNPVNLGTLIANESKLIEVVLRNTGRQTLRTFDYSVTTADSGEQGSFSAHGMGNSCDDGEIPPNGTCMFLVGASSQVSSSNGGNGLDVALTGMAVITVVAKSSNQRVMMTVPLRAQLVPCMVDSECSAGEICYRRRCAPQ